MTTELIQAENTVRKIRKLVAEGKNYTDALATSNTLKIPDGGNAEDRRRVVRMLNETIALIQGARPRPFRGETLRLGQLVYLPYDSPDHVGATAKEGWYEVAVYNGPDEDDDIAICELQDTYYRASEAHAMDRRWVKVRLVDILDLDEDDDEDDDGEEDSAEQADTPVIEMHGTADVTCRIGARAGDLREKVGDLPLDAPLTRVRRSGDDLTFTFEW